MSVHYKFKSALDYDTVTFDGLHISIGDLKAAISQQKRIGKTSDFDLEITNAQTKEIYVDDNTLIPKNTSLLVARVPLAQQPKKQWEGHGNNVSALQQDAALNKGIADLSRMEGSEQDKINAMISQSTHDYDPSNYQKIRGQNQKGVVPPTYICYKCQKRGHWIKDCPLANTGEPVDIKRSTGIPRSFMVPVDGPKAPGAMMTPGGTFAVPAVDHEAYLASESAGGAETMGGVPAAPDPSVPDELTCSLCRDLLVDAVMIPCCGNSFCDECIRGALLESEDHECPDCREKEIAPTTLIPNRFLRNSVSSFRNQTGYSRRQPHRPSAGPPQRVLPIEAQPAPIVNQPNAPNGTASVPDKDARRRNAGADESDGSADDNVVVKVPPVHMSRSPENRDRQNIPPRTAMLHRPPPRHAGQRHPGAEPGMRPISAPRMDEKRASTPTIDERRDPMAQGMYNRGPPPPGFAPNSHLPPRPPFLNPPRGPFRNEPYQPPPPGIKDSPPNGGGELDPLEAFNRMIREKEMRAKRREEERRRALHSKSRSPGPVRSPGPRSPGARRSRSPLGRGRSRSPGPIGRGRSRSPGPLLGRGRSRSPVPPTRGRSRSPRPLHSPPPRPRSPPSVRQRYSRSRSISRTRVRRSPLWSPRRRRSRTLSLSRSPSPRRRGRSPPRYRSPPRRSPLRSPMRSPRHPAMRSPRPLSPHRFAGVYDELLSPPRRNVDPQYGARYGPRSNVPPAVYGTMGIKPVPLMNNIPIQAEPIPYRGRYDAPPYDNVPPGVEPPVPGFEPSPFEKPPFGPLPNDRDRLLPPNFRDQYRPPPFIDAHPAGYREAPVPVPITNAIPPTHPIEPRFRDSYRSFRDQPPGQFRDQVPPPYRDNNFRGGPPQPNFREAGLRNHAFREPGYRDGAPPFRPPSSEPQGNFIEPNAREDVPRDHRPGYRSSNRSRGGSRRHQNSEQDRQERYRERDRERYNETREPAERDRNRDPEKRSGYEKTHDKPHEFDRQREYDKDRERDYDKGTPERRERTPKRRDRKRSESKDREGRKEKKEERSRDKTSAETAKEHKDKDKKLKDRKKKKREKEKEKEKDVDKKKKREKKDKKEKEITKKEDENTNKEKDEVSKSIDAEKNESKISHENSAAVSKGSSTTKTSPRNKPNLYDDVGETEEVDKSIVQNYLNPKKEDANIIKNSENNSSKEEIFDGIELQVNPDELDLKIETEVNAGKEMLAKLPERSKWEVDDDSERREPGEVTSPDKEEDSGKVTSDVIKRAEKAIFSKAITSSRPIEIKKISSDRLKHLSDEQKPKSSIQITVPVAEADQRSIEINDKRHKKSKTPPPKLSVKERLGGKVDDMKRPRGVVQSTVERVKSRSKTPKIEQPYRRVTVDRERNKKPDLIVETYSQESTEAKHRSEKLKEVSTKITKDLKISSKMADRRVQNVEKDKSSSLDRDRKKSMLDEANFVPDYDENVDTDNESKGDSKKRDRSKSPTGPVEAKKPKLENEDTIKLDLTNVKKKPDTETDSSSDSEESSSSSSSDARKKKKKKKRTSKKKKKRVASESESETDSESDHKKKKKKRKHKKKSSKKKKKSKHK